MILYSDHSHFTVKAVGSCWRRSSRLSGPARRTHRRCVCLGRAEHCRMKVLASPAGGIEVRTHIIFFFVRGARRLRLRGDRAGPPKQPVWPLRYTPYPLAARGSARAPASGPREVDGASAPPRRTAAGRRAESADETLHNVHAHDQENPSIQRALMRLVTRLVHGVIFLPASSREAAYAEMPGIASKPFAIIPHGLYGQRSERSRDEARTCLGRPAGSRVLGFLGDIRRYKGLDVLLDAFARTPPGQVSLLVGVFPDETYGFGVERHLAELSAQGHAIISPGAAR